MTITNLPDVEFQTTSRATIGSATVLRALSQAVLRIVLGITVSFGTALVWAQTPNDEPWHWRNVSRVVAFGDVHGDYSALVRLLQAAEVIDANRQWQAGKTHLVSLGDLLDRGPESRKVLDLLQQLEHEANEAGGRVHIVLGNHEAMVMTGDLRYVSRPEFAAFASDQATVAPVADSGAPPGHDALIRAFAPGGHYGRWLINRPALIAIDNTAFMHGGLSSVAGAAQGGLTAINSRFSNALGELIPLGKRLVDAGVIPADEDLVTAAWRLGKSDEDAAAAAVLASNALSAQELDRFIAAGKSDLLGNSGPLWYRGSSECHPAIETERIKRWVHHLGVARIAVGHTPTPRRTVATRLSETVIRLDTGMLHAYYKGRGHAMIVENGITRFVNESGQPVTPLIETAQVNPPYATDEDMELWLQVQEGAFMALEANDTLSTPLAGKRYTVTLNNRTTTARFQPMRKRAAAREVMAYKVDRALGFGLVPVTVARDVDGMSGIAWMDDGTWIGEAERVVRGLNAPNWCEQGHVYELIPVFDALLGNRQRSADNVHHNPIGWRVRLVDHARAFGTNRKLVAGAAPKLAPGVVQSLQSLSSPALSALAKTHGLPAKEVTSLLARRDALLALATNE